MFVRTLLLLGGVIILPSMATAQSVWERILDDSDMAVYIDRASVAGSGGYRSISTRTVYLSLAPEGNVVERIRTEEFDCAGCAPLFESWGPDEAQWYTINPQSLGSRKLNAACGR